MTFTFTQTNPRMLLNGGTIMGAPLYSGHGDGLNNPAMEAVHNVGPIPAGAWHIIEWLDTYENKGPCVARLEPAGHDAHGRSGFLIHGDNEFGNHTASDGCIVAGLAIRQTMRECADRELEVIP